MTGSSLLQNAARRHRADEWLGTTTLPGELHVRHWAPDQRALPALRLRRERSVPAGLRTTSGLWSLGADADRLVKIDVSEQRSRLAAHHALTRVLAEVQSPVLARAEGDPVGDVAFSAPGGHLAVFARGNLVVIVAGVGRRQVDATAIATLLDASLRRPPPADAERSVSGQLASRLSQVSDTVRRVDVRVPPVLRARGLPMLRVFAPRGHLYERADQLLYEPAGPDVHGWLTVYEEEPGGTPRPRVVLRERL